MGAPVGSDRLRPGRSAAVLTRRESASGAEVAAKRAANMSEWVWFRI